VSTPEVALGRRKDGGHAGLAPCTGFLTVEGASGSSEGQYRSRGRLDEGLDRRGPAGGPSSRGGRVGDRGGVRRSSSWPLHRRVHAGSSEFGRRNRRLWRRAGAPAPGTRRSPSEQCCLSKGNPRTGTRCTGRDEASETPLRVRDDRSQGVPGLRVGCRSQSATSGSSKSRRLRLEGPTGT
jgi:hypothetical protein